MSHQPISESLRLFLSDLAAVRVEKEVSLEDIQAVTKVYPHIISQFEEDGLQDHHLFNHLYVRAFVRSYAKVVGIPQDETAEVYDNALKGRYRRQLAIAYLGLDPEEVGPEDDRLPAVEEDVREVPRVIETPVERRSNPVTSNVSSGSRIEYRPAPTETEATDWLDSLKEQGNKLIELARENGALQWGILVVGIGLSLIVIFQLLSLNDKEEESPLATMTEEPAAETRNTGETDTLVATPAVVQPLPLEDVVLKDSLELFVVASTGKLDPFRVKVDNDMRRPYWLDEGDSMRFYVSNRVTVEDNLEAMEILLEGYTYPIYSTDSLAIVVIDRDSMRTFLASHLR